MARLWPIVKAASEKTNLKPATCMDLLQSGWTFIDQVGQPPRWEAPVSQLKKE